MNRNIVETALGAIVLGIAIMFGVFAYGSAHVEVGHGYDVTAKFDHIDGTQAGGDVKISGIKVGTILSQKLDPKTFQAILRLNIDDSVKLPVDTVATITSPGLLGDKYLQLVPGADDQTIPPNGEIKFTQPPVSLEQLLGQFVYSQGGSGGGAAKPAAPGAGAAGTDPKPSAAAAGGSPAPSAPPAAH